MKLSEVLDYINQALNYPALIYSDISLYFDTAIAELNTTLHISIPTVSEMLSEFRQNMSKNADTVILTKDPTVDANVNIPTEASDNSFYYDITTRKYYTKIPGTSTYTEHSELHGVYIRNGVREFYGAYAFGTGAAWALESTPEYDDFNIANYLPDEWVLLWLIPYICFKYTVRDGGTAQTFAEELTQGYQQLQETYNVPYYVHLADVAGKYAYASLVESHLNNLNMTVRTRAIYESMKHARNTNGIYGSMFDRGGF